MNNESDELQTPKYWHEIYKRQTGLEIRDPDGFVDPPDAWDMLMTYDDFLIRANDCIMVYVKK